MASHIPLQIGLTTFAYNSTTNTYTGTTYNFYIMPRECGPVEPSFTFRSSCVTFLCHHNFDFNQAFYEGISYLNRKSEQLLFNVKESEPDLSEIPEEKINIEINRIKEWLKNPDDNFRINEMEADCLYLLRSRIEKLFPEAYSLYNPKGELIMQKCASVEECSRLKTERNRRQSLKFDLYYSLLGFTRIFRLIVDAKKPIIGHNMYLDLIVMYQQFENPLPKDYRTFKTEVKRLFPMLYDTKYLSYIINRLPKPTRIDGQIEMKKTENSKQWPIASLKHLYDYFKDREQTSRFRYGTSTIVGYGDGSFHDAGYDSYCTGYVFINLASILVSIHYESNVERMVTSMEMMTMVKKYVNRINMIHGGVLYMNLDGADPPFVRCLLFATKLRAGQERWKNKEISENDICAVS